MKKSVPVFSDETPVVEPTLPTHEMAEKFILGAILLDNTVMPGPDLQPEHFSLDTHQRIYKAMLVLSEFNSGIDIVTLSHELKRTKDLDRIYYGVAYLVSLTEGMMMRFYVGDYVKIVKEKYRLRQIIHACQKATDRAWDQSEDAADIIFTLQKEIGIL